MLEYIKVSTYADVRGVDVKVWVEDEAGHYERKDIWKNDGAIGTIDWGNVNLRLGLDGKDDGNECAATFSEDVWNVIKTGTFYLVLSGDAPQIRVTDGWWSTPWTADDIFAGNEVLADNGDGTMTLTVNFNGSPLLDVLDAQHLLFTGGGFVPLKLYYK